MIPKLRAWDHLEKHMSYGRISNHYDDSLLYRFDHFECDPEEVIYMQYTGLKDKNGVEIYEGDVVGYKWDRDPHYDIESVVLVKIPDFYLLYQRHEFEEDYKSYDYEIIGNIYENPELLKERSHV